MKCTYWKLQESGIFYFKMFSFWWEKYGLFNFFQVPNKQLKRPTVQSTSPSKNII